MRTKIPKALPLSRVVLPCAYRVGLKMESPGSLPPGWYWVRLVIQEYAWCMEGGIKHHSLFSGGLLRESLHFTYLGADLMAHYEHRKAAKWAFHPKSPFPAYSPAPGRPEWGACSGPWRSHRILKQMTNWHVELRCSHRRTWLPDCPKSLEFVLVGSSLPLLYLLLPAAQLTHDDVIPKTTCSFAVAAFHRPSTELLHQAFVCFSDPSATLFRSVFPQSFLH